MAVVEATQSKAFCYGSLSRLTQSPSAPLDTGMQGLLGAEMRQNKEETSILLTPR